MPQLPPLVVSAMQGQHAGPHSVKFVDAADQAAHDEHPELWQKKIVRPSNWIPTAPHGEAPAAVSSLPTAAAAPVATAPSSSSSHDAPDAPNGVFQVTYTEGPSTVEGAASVSRTVVLPVELSTKLSGHQMAVAAVQGHALPNGRTSSPLHHFYNEKVQQKFKEYTQRSDVAVTFGTLSKKYSRFLSHALGYLVVEGAKSQGGQERAAFHRDCEAAVADIGNTTALTKLQFQTIGTKWTMTRHPGCAAVKMYGTELITLSAASHQ
jgi:hypothetical protein